jgi:hypothetical protein
MDVHNYNPTDSLFGLYFIRDVILENISQPSGAKVFLGGPAIGFKTNSPEAPYAIIGINATNGVKNKFLLLTFDKHGFELPTTCNSSSLLPNFFDTITGTQSNSMTYAQIGNQLISNSTAGAEDSNGFCQ